jgi:hypothetical protein
MKPTIDRSTLAKNPAYKEYPADILNNEVFMQMTLPQRGLYWTMRMYCWRNGTIPSAWEELSQLVGIKKDALEKLIADGKVLRFFDNADDLTRMYCPDLEAYRQELLEKQRKRSENGKKAAEKQLRDRLNGNAISDEMGSDMNRTAYDVDESMNGYLTRQLN